MARITPWPELPRPTLLAMKVGAVEQWQPMAWQNCLYLHYQGDFQHQNRTVGSLHDSDHNGVVRIFVGSYLYIRTILKGNSTILDTTGMMRITPADQAGLDHTSMCDPNHMIINVYIIWITWHALVTPS